MMNPTDENKIIKLVLETVQRELELNQQKIINEVKKANATIKEDVIRAKVTIKDEVTKGDTHISELLKDVMIKINNRYSEIEQLTGGTLNEEAGKKITNSYNKLADIHQNQERLFQFICGFSIFVAIAFLISWIIGFFPNYLPDLNSSPYSYYFWLPIATITSLFLFLARWSARISYRHGLESKRLNQYALDLSTMPAYFAQSLLNDDDKDFAKRGKNIVYDSSGKLFGNIERFNEQHQHSFIELFFKHFGRNKIDPIEHSDELEKSEEEKQASANSGTKSPTIDTKSP